MSEKLKIGDLLYRYVWSHGSFKYEVIGIRNYKESVLFELKCLECRDHEACEVLVIQEKSKDEKYKFVEMINNYDGYDEDIHDQTLWHKDNKEGTEFFYRDKKSCCAAYGNILIYKSKQRVEKAENELKAAKNESERICKWIEETTS
jgi:hypothetical protein